MISFYFTEAIKSFFRAKFASIITILTIALSSLFASFSLYLLFNSNKITRYLKDKIEITIFLKNDASETDIYRLKLELLQDRRIKSIVFKDKEKAAKEMSEYLGVNIKKTLQNNPLPSSFSIHVNSALELNGIKKLIARYKKNKIVDDIIFDKQLLNELLKSILYLKFFTYSFSALTIILALYLMIIVNKFSIDRRKEIFEIMKLVGAKLSMIRAPVFLSAIILGIVASIISSVLILLILNSLNKFNLAIFFNRKFLVLTNIFVSLSLGIIGGVFSVKNININFTHKKQT